MRLFKAHSNERHRLFAYSHFDVAFNLRPLFYIRAHAKTKWEKKWIEKQSIFIVIKMFISSTPDGKLTVYTRKYARKIENSKTGFVVYSAHRLGYGWLLSSLWLAIYISITQTLAFKQRREREKFNFLPFIIFFIIKFNSGWLKSRKQQQQQK